MRKTHLCTGPFLWLPIIELGSQLYAAFYKSIAPYDHLIFSDGTNSFDCDANQILQECAQGTNDPNGAVVQMIGSSPAAYFSGVSW